MSDCNHFYRAIDSRRSQCSKCGEIEKSPCREPECVALQQKIDACEPYLKEGETPAECIARNRKDVVMAAGQWAEALKRVEALEKLLDPETLARKIGDWDFRHNSDYFCFKFGGDGDNGEMLIEAIAAILQKEE